MVSLILFQGKARILEPFDMVYEPETWETVHTVDTGNMFVWNWLSAAATRLSCSSNNPRS